MPRRYRLVLRQVAASALLVLGAPAAAQTLSLSDAQALVSEYSLDVDAAAAQVRASEAMVEQARAYWRPSVVATAGYRYDSLEQQLVPATLYEPLAPWLDAIAGQTPGLPGADALLQESRDPIELSPRHAVQGEIAVTQPLLAPAATAARSVATAQVDASAQRLRVTAFVVTLAVTQTYFEALRYEALAEAAETAAAQADAEVSRAAARVREGVATPFELDAARTVLLRNQRDVAAAQTGASLARDALFELVGAGRDEALDAPRTGPPATNVEQAVSAAIAHNPELDAATAQRDVAQSAVRAERASFYPTAQARLAARAQRPTGVTDQRFAWTASVGLEWTLFAGGARAAQVEAANARLDATDAAARRNEQRIRGEVRRLWMRLEQAERDLELAGMERELAEQALALARVARDEGVGTSVDVEIALERRNGAERAEVIADVARLEVEALLRLWSSGE